MVGGGGGSFLIWTHWISTDLQRNAMIGAPSWPGFENAYAIIICWASVEADYEIPCWFDTGVLLWSGLKILFKLNVSPVFLFFESYQCQARSGRILLSIQHRCPTMFSPWNTAIELSWFFFCVHWKFNWSAYFGTTFLRCTVWCRNINMGMRNVCHCHLLPECFIGDRCVPLWILILQILCSIVLRMNTWW